MANVNTLRFSVKGSSGYLLKILLKAIVEDIVNLLTMTIIRAGHHDIIFFSNRRGIYLPSCTRMRQFTPSRNNGSSSFKIVAEICRDAHLCNSVAAQQSVCPSKKYLFPAWKI